MNKKYIEPLKSLIIILLVLAGIWLFLSVRALSGGEGRTAVSLVAELFSREKPEAGETASFTEAARPSCAAVTFTGGRYGALFNEIAVSGVYDQCLSTLGEALGTAAAPSETARSRWRALLGEEGVYFEYDAAFPVSALAAWLGTDFDYELNFYSLLLTHGDDDAIELYLYDGEKAYCCATSALWSSLDLAQFRSNETSFAFELAQRDDIWNGAEPMSLVAEDMPLAFEALSVTNPLENEAARVSLLERLGLNPYADYLEAEGARVYSDASCRLSMDERGRVSLRMLSDGPAALDSPAAVIEAARALASFTVGASAGEASLCLSEYSYDAETGDCVVAFAYRYAGIPVEGAAATVGVSGGRIVSAELDFRRFEAAGSQTYVLPPYYAAALPNVGLKLVYTVSSTSATADWELTR